MNIENRNNDTLISGTSDADKINNYGSNVTILAADGRDTINNFGSNVTINTEGDNDYIQNNAENVTINGGDGKDQIRSVGSYVMINGDADTDYLWSSYRSNSDIFADLIEGVTLNGGAGDDTIGCESGNRNLFIGGNGDDSIFSGNSSKPSYNTTIFAGDGNDTIRNYGEHALIYGGAGNDLLSNEGGKYPTIVGGAGDDTITFNGGSDNDEYFIEYTEGDGNDVVKPSYRSHTINLSILRGNHTVYKDGNDLLVIVGDGSIRFLGMAGKSININGTPIIAETSTPSTTTQNLIPISATTPTATNNSGGITNIYNAPVYINNTTINNTTINETNINYITSVNNTYIYNGGDKVINNYVEGQAVQLTSDYQGIDFNGNSFFVNSSSGQLEIQNSRDKFIGYSGHDNNVVAYSYWASGGGNIDGRGKNQVEILIGGDNANNQIFAGSGGSSLWGGNGGTDTLTGGDGYDEFFYAIGSGNDVIQNASDNDVVNLLGVSLSQISYAEVKSSDISIGFTDGGKLQLQGQSATGFKLENVTYTANRSTGSWDTK